MNELEKCAEILVKCQSEITLTGKEERRNHRLYLQGKCSCGSVEYYRLDNLKQRGGMKSCGCKRKENFTTKTHGMRNSGLYTTWDGMHQRCYNKNNKSYKYYGRKGVKVYTSWRYFMEFADWAMKNGWKEGLTIERKNSNGNYEPGNCEFITQSENSKRVNHKRDSHGQFAIA